MKLYWVSHEGKPVSLSLGSPLHAGEPSPTHTHTSLVSRFGSRQCECALHDTRWMDALWVDDTFRGCSFLLILLCGRRFQWIELISSLLYHCVSLACWALRVCAEKPHPKPRLCNKAYVLLCLAATPRSHHLFAWLFLVPESYDVCTCMCSWLSWRLSACVCRGRLVRWD